MPIHDDGVYKDVGAALQPHASTHVDGGSDEITSKLDYRAMNILRARATSTTIFSTSSTSYVDLTGISVNVSLPASSVVLVFFQCWSTYNNTIAENYERILRGTTALKEIKVTGCMQYDTGGRLLHNNSMIQTMEVDVSAGSYTYKVQVKVGTGLGYWDMGTTPAQGEICVIAFPY